MTFRVFVHTSDERFAFYAHVLEASGDMNELSDRRTGRRTHTSRSDEFCISRAQSGASPVVDSCPCGPCMPHLGW